MKLFYWHSKLMPISVIFYINSYLSRDPEQEQAGIGDGWMDSYLLVTLHSMIDGWINRWILFFNLRHLYIFHYVTCLGLLLSISHSTLQTINKK